MIPMGGGRISLNPRMAEVSPDAYLPMGNTAENVARQFKVGREEQDAFALRSHQKALAAWAEGRFAAGGRAGQDPGLRGRAPGPRSRSTRTRGPGPTPPPRSWPRSSRCSTRPAP